MDLFDWTKLLVEVFPRLSSESFKIVARPSIIRYNCIAYAAGDVSEWWEHEEDHYWPDYATRSNRMESLIEVFAGLGFQKCQNSGLEIGYEKVALYEQQGVWKHAARQTPTGHWRSKMGEGPLIEHPSPDSLSGGMYGRPTVIMRRPVNHAPIPE